MGIRIDDTLVINDDRVLQNTTVRTDVVSVDTGSVDLTNPSGSITYHVPAETSSNANGADSGGLFVRAGSSWSYRLGATGFGRTTAWSGANTLVCSVDDDSGTDVTSQLSGIKDGDYLSVYFSSTRYGLYQVNDTSIFSSSLAYFFDVDFVSGTTSLHGNTTDETVYLKYDYAPIVASVSALNQQAGTLTINPITWVNFDGTGTIAARDSQNVSSLTDNTTGDYTVNFSNTMSNATYCVNVTAGGRMSSYGSRTTLWNDANHYATTSNRFRMMWQPNSGYYDTHHVNFALVGDG